MKQKRLCDALRSLWIRTVFLNIDIMWLTFWRYLLASIFVYKGLVQLLPDIINPITAIVFQITSLCLLQTVFLMAAEIICKVKLWLGLWNISQWVSFWIYQQGLKALFNLHLLPCDNVRACICAQSQSLQFSAKDPWCATQKLWSIVWELRV